MPWARRDDGSSDGLSGGQQARRARGTSAGPSRATGLRASLTASSQASLARYCVRLVCSMLAPMSRLIRRVEATGNSCATLPLVTPGQTP